MLPSAMAPSPAFRSATLTGAWPLIRRVLGVVASLYTLPSSAFTVTTSPATETTVPTTRSIPANCVRPPTCSPGSCAVAARVQLATPTAIAMARRRFLIRRRIKPPAHQVYGYTDANAAGKTPFLTLNCGPSFPARLTPAFHASPGVQHSSNTSTTHARCPNKATIHSLHRIESGLPHRQGDSAC